MANWKRYQTTAKKDPVKGWFIALTVVMLLLLSVYKFVIYNSVTLDTFNVKIVSVIFSIALALTLEGVRGVLLFMGLKDYERKRYLSAALGLSVSVFITALDIREAAIHNVLGDSENNWIMGVLSVLVVVLELRVGLYYAGGKDAIQGVKIAQNHFTIEGVKMMDSKEEKPHESKPKPKNKKKSEKKRIGNNIRQWKYQLRQAEEAENYEKAAKARDKIKYYESLR